jgi:hypothetical protein
MSAACPDLVFKGVINFQFEIFQGIQNDGEDPVAEIVEMMPKASLPTPEHFDATRRGLADIQGHMLPVEDRDGSWIFVVLTPEEQVAFGHLLTKIGVGKASHDIARCTSER